MALKNIFAESLITSNMEKHILSKSTFIKGYHCLKSLYLYKNRPFLRDKLTAEQRAKFKRGHEVGNLAQQLFTGGIDVSPKSPSQYQKSVIQTQELIIAGQKVIYEATFQYNQVLVMLDLLVKKEDGWHAYEVKSSKKLSETYFTDAALQYWVISNSGTDLQSFSLVYVAENYRLQDQLDLDSYFIFQDVTENILSRQDFIAEKVLEEKAIIKEKHSPKIAVGDHCFRPYKCDFVGFCWKKIADKPYIPSELSFENILQNKRESPTLLSLIFQEEAVPKCEKQKAYSPQILGFKYGDTEVDLLENTCEGKKKFAETLISKTAHDQDIVIFDKTPLKKYLEELIQLYPPLEGKAQKLLNQTHGIIDTMIEEQLIFQEQKDLYTAAWFSKNYFSNDCKLHELPVYSDVLAVELYQKTKKDLLSNHHPDHEILKNYLDELQKLTRLLYEKL